MSHFYTNILITVRAPIEAPASIFHYDPFFWGGLLFEFFKGGLVLEKGVVLERVLLLGKRAG